MKRTYILLVAIIVIIALAVAILTFGSLPQSFPSPSPSPGVFLVEIIDFSFAPQQLTIAAGTAVEWINRGAENHTTTNYSSAMGPIKAWDSGILKPGQTFNYTFTQTGTYKYRCNLHSTTMFGRIIVVP